MDLNGKCVLLGVPGGIAAYKMANVASALRKLGADVEVIMTKNATQFITPLTFETLTGHKCMVDTFDRDFKFEVTHISLAKKADVILVAPATANVIAKMAHGIADDMLTTTVLAAKCPKLVSPAMNTGMLENPITQDNIATLERYGFTVIPSESGVLACKDVGSGRLPKEDVLIEYILHAIARPKDLAGLRIAVTAGPTQEPLDPVRYLTNHSTGKMGYAIARAAAMRGADVTLIHGETALQPVKFTTDVPVTTAQQMYEAVTSRFDATDVLIMAAAVADYRPVTVASDKIKKKDGDLSIPVERTPDILGTIGPQKTHQFLCGFSMETKDLVENSSAKLAKKIQEGILEAKPDANCQTYDIIEHDMAQLHALINHCKAFAVGSPTLNRDAVPPVWNLLAGVDAINSGKKPALVFGSYGWTGEAVGNIQARLQGLKMNVFEDGFKVAFVPTEDDLEAAKELGKNFAMSF